MSGFMYGQFDYEAKCSAFGQDGKNAYCSMKNLLASCALHKCVRLVRCMPKFSNIHFDFEIIYCLVGKCVTAV